MVATENAARSPRATPTPETFSASPEPTMSRDQIAQSLASKSPDWFKQTADRGVNSPAYRKNQVEDENRSDHGSIFARVQMPGMSREVSESGKVMDEPVDRSMSPSRGSTFGSVYQASPKLSGGLGSPMPLTPAQIFDPPSETRSEGRSLAMSPSQGRISPDRVDRPISPTKGMGGFVQSAMMKRSDSVNKRWSVQSPPGLSRGNSVASNRGGHDLSGSIGSAAGRDIKPSSLSRDDSPRPNSRPTSSHSNTTLTQDRPGTSSSMRSSVIASTTDSFVKPPLPAVRNQTPVDVKPSSIEEPAEPTPREDKTPPTSPSKTMDSRRWSPTKSSWLESALNKPESPKPKAVLPPQQPVWMSEINKAKQKASVDLGRSPTNGPKHEVSIGGLMRSPPMGGPAKPSSIGGLPGGFSSGATPKGRSDSIVPQERKGSMDSNASTPLAKPSSVISKARPETPPKKDFRAGLKPRQHLPDSNSSNEPEFKNMFGQLRRTKTQNYVAPDELKDNITRGKSALNITGGPKKTERKDEFREAILKKKEDFKQAQTEGKGIIRSSSGSQDAPLPEALAKRRALGRSGSIAANSEANGIDLSPKHTSQEAPKPSLLNETSSLARLEGKESVGGKLAGRLNPSLASLLARGPPSMASDTSRSSSPALSQRTVSKSESTSESVESGPQLTHMTKARARGPRRKAPTSVPATAVASADTTNEFRSIEVVESSPKRFASEVKASTPSVEVKTFSKSDAENPVSQPSSPRKLDLERRSQFLQEVSNKNNKPEPQLDSPKPLSPTKKANIPEKPVKPQEPKTEVQAVQTPRLKPTAPAKSLSLASNTSPTSPALSRIESPETAKLHPSPLSPTKSKPADKSSKEMPNAIKPNTPVSVKGGTAQWENDRITTPLRVKSPIKLPTHQDEKAAMVRAGLRPASLVKEIKSVGLGIQTAQPSARPLPTPPNKGPLSPLSAELRSPVVSQDSDALKMLDDFFGDHKSATQFRFDTGALLSARPDQDTNIKTLRSSLYQIFSDGKKQLVPSHQERILFEENLYLCTHIFGNTAGRKTIEIYLWRGDQVTNAIVEETMAFAEREAKSSGGKLVTIRQGKETPEFFNALGGIIIIRRGSSNKYDSLAPHILCGRRHFGQIAFDEVDFSPNSLCSGFPYLISTQSGKCYLWKGKGSGIEELSCARLIGMDFGLTGEIEEIEDGKEPQSFLDIFGKGSQIPKSADHWRMKPNYNKYCIRLFVADADARQQVILSTLKRTKPLN